jgi:Type VI secretion system effector, Hcp
MDGMMGRVRSWLKGHLKLAGMSAVVGLGVAAALAIASVPDNSGVIHACLEVENPPAGGVIPKTPGPNLRVIDPDAPVGVPEAAKFCNETTELPLNWNQQGPAGPPGAAGAAGAGGGGGGGGECSASVGHVKLNASLQSDVCTLKQVKIGERSSARGGPSGPSTEYEMTRFIDALSPKLQKAAIQGTLFQSAKVQVYSPGTTNVVKTFSLSNAAISSIQIGQGQVKPTESIKIISVPKKGV